VQEDKGRYYFEFVPGSLPPNFGLLNPKAMYFIRMSKAAIPVMTSMEQAMMEMPKHLMYGTMHGYQLRPVQAVLAKVIIVIVFAVHH